MRWMTRSLHRKLSILLIACIIIPVLLLGYVSYRTAWSISEEKSKQASLNTLRQISAILETIAQDVENMSVFLIGQHDVQQYLAKDRASANDYLRMVGFFDEPCLLQKLHRRHPHHPAERQPGAVQYDGAVLSSVRAGPV
ncbi:hypothetical protein L5D93_22570 [Paenibacillus thiaminolyticus]|nr:hypothetical protein [Paenibacillus thiaminolyticus]